MRNSVTHPVVCKYCYNGNFCVSFNMSLYYDFGGSSCVTDMFVVHVVTFYYFCSNLAVLNLYSTAYHCRPFSSLCQSNLT